MITEYRAVQALVADVFDGVFAEPATGEDEISLAANVQGTADDGALIEDLRVRGFAEPEATAHRLRAVLDSRRMQAMTGAARTGVERLLRRALQAAIERSRETGSAHDIGPDQHFARFAQLADVIAGRSTYIALLNQFPQAFDKVMRMLAASRWATDYLARHPMLLDELLDQRLLEHEPDWPSWSIAVRQQLTEANGDHERQMNLLRDAHHAQVFRLLVADLDGRLTVERLADHLSALADATLTLAIEYAWRALPRRHRDVPRFAVIGYGKLGGKELGYESDLDLIFLYDDEDPAAAEVYLLFTRRLMTWLSAHTSSGKLFEIDLRLRPDGNTGLLVSPFDAFARYQRNEDGLGAWPWEHQALTRARYSAGDPEIGERFEAERTLILMQRRDKQKLCTDVLQMRARMLDGHPNPTGLFDVKHDRGGMVDVEFIVQFLVLAHAHEHAELVRNVGNIALLHMAGQLQLIDTSLAREVADAYRTFRSIQHRLRLNGAERARVAPQEVEREAAAVTRLWNSVFTPLPEATVSARKDQHADRHCSDHAARGQRDHSRGKSCDQLRIGNRQIECALRQEQLGRDERNQSAHGCIAQPVLHSFRQRKIIAEHQKTRAHQDRDQCQPSDHQPDFKVAQLVPPVLAWRSSMISALIAAAMPATTATNSPSFSGSPAATTAITPAVTAPINAGLPEIIGSVIAISARIAVNSRPH